MNCLDIEIEAERAELKVEVGHQHIGIDALRHRKGDVVGERRGTGSALGADKGDDAPELIFDGVAKTAMHRGDEVNRVERHHQVVADACIQEPLVEADIVRAADDDDLSAGDALHGESFERRHKTILLVEVLDDDEVRRSDAAVKRRRLLYPAFLDCHGGARHPAVVGRRADRLHQRLGAAEDGDVYLRNGQERRHGRPRGLLDIAAKLFHLSHNP